MFHRLSKNLAGRSELFVHGSILAEAEGTLSKMRIGWTTLRVCPLLVSGVGECGCNTGQTLWMGLSAWPVGLGGQEQVEARGTVLASASRRDQQTTACLAVALDWSLIPLPALGLAPLAWGTAQNSSVTE